MHLVALRRRVAGASLKGQLLVLLVQHEDELTSAFRLLYARACSRNSRSCQYDYATPPFLARRLSHVRSSQSDRTAPSDSNASHKRRKTGPDNTMGAHPADSWTRVVGPWTDGPYCIVLRAVQSVPFPLHRLPGTVLSMRSQAIIIPIQLQP